MDWIIGVLLLITGVVIGFFLAKYWFESKVTPQLQDDKETMEQELLTQQTLQHIEDSRSLLNNMQNQCEELQQKINDFENLARKSGEGQEQDKLEFFGGPADTYLSNKQSSTSREKVKAEYQPRDYAKSGSGLFVGDEKTQEIIDNAEKS